ncbi:hypothetical protein Sjap_026481 [Stephania japonica]|uniref:VTT domain-containing protein n=1 Tax=Stephania japonica TaxID=461633 RepID=A0AAP0HKH4_9MAGN
MINSSEGEARKHSPKPEDHSAEESEYVRLFIPNEPRITDASYVQGHGKSKYCSLAWWMRAFLWSLLLSIVVVVSLKWGVPFLLEKVLIPIMQWEATAFGRPVLALVLVGSLALFPVLLIPSGPSMWLAGMIFGYGIGFVIIMVGTTIGMILPYWIGSLFRDRIHRAVVKDIRRFAFTVYAKRALDKLKADGDGEGSEGGAARETPSNFEMEKLPLEMPKHLDAVALPSFSSTPSS